jgi:hypothetical protein
MSQSFDNPPHGLKAQTPARGPSSPPLEEKEPADKTKPAVFLGTKKRLPEFVLTDKVVLVTGGARGLGLTQAEALLEAGATGKVNFALNPRAKMLTGAMQSTPLID